MASVGSYAGTGHPGGRPPTFYGIGRENMSMFAHRNKLVLPRASRATSPQPSRQVGVGDRP